MNRLDQLREQIDACRPGSDDLHLPELAELKAAVASSPRGEVAAELDRAGRFDRSVTSALYDVPVPAGLVDRLLAATAAPPVGLAGIEPALDDAPAAAPAADLPQAASSGPSSTRRGWLLRVGSIALAAAAAVAIGVFVSNQKPREVAAQQLATDISTWYGEASLADDWNSEQSPQQISIASYVASRRALPWRNYRTPTGETAVVYQVAGKQGLLFVVSTQAKYLVPPLPGGPLSGTTGDIQAVAWQRPGKLYVLIIKGKDLPIESFLIHRHVG